MAILTVFNINVLAQGLGQEPVPLSALETPVCRIISILVPLAGFGLVIMIIVGGFRILFSAGDPKAIEAGRNTLTWAFTGFGLVIIAWFFLLLLGEITGRDLTQFLIAGLRPAGCNLLGPP